MTKAKSIRCGVTFERPALTVPWSLGRHEFLRDFLGEAPDGPANASVAVANVMVFSTWFQATFQFPHGKLSAVRLIPVIQSGSELNAALDAAFGEAKIFDVEDERTLRWSAEGVTIERRFGGERARVQDQLVIEC